MFKLSDVKTNQELVEDYNKARDETGPEQFSYFEMFRRGYMEAVEQVMEKELKELTQEALRTPELLTKFKEG